MNRIFGAMKIHLRDKWSWIYIPWLVLLSSFLINLVVSYFVLDTEIYTGGIASIFIFMLVSGMVTVHQTFPFALGFNVRRTDYFLGTLLTVILVGSLTALALFFLSIVENQWIVRWGTELYFFHLPYLNDGSALAQIWTVFVMLLHMYFLGFTISTIYRKFGKTGFFIFAIASFLLFSLFTLLSSYFHWWGQIGNYVIGFTAAEWATRLFVLVMVYLLSSYAMLRRSTVS